ncbi:AraC family transcriptional regulator [Mycobacterium spongiae]|uniref:Helix-turn-helix domain-containing protein n=1 Tax=Mycobacterium spongiae TaxID=886343 RepID=A0A975JY26_9MYCO|nr:AraC family transcriptional regulator [Mycobacterium spongiae]QUR67816.1 helix-turn-helix domain-containing protein [Mycobacterium spongiae]
MSLIRGTALTGYPELVTELGADPDSLLHAAGIPREGVGDPEAYVGYRNVIAAVESAARATGARDFGRQLAKCQGIEILGPVGAAARTARSVAEAFSAISHYLAVYSPAIATRIEPTPDPKYARAEFRIVLGDLPDHRQTTELSLGVTLRIFRLLIGIDFAPVVVHLPHEPLAARADYVHYFGGAPRFAEPFSGFTIRTVDLGRPVSSATGVHEVVRAYLDSITPPGAPDTVALVRALIRHLLPTRGLQLTLVARQLSMHPRTLQRHLMDRSTTFDEMVDGIRQERARELLRDTNMPMNQLAGALGYSEQSVLTRACRRWFGRPPLRERKHLRAF